MSERDFRLHKICKFSRVERSTNRSMTSGDRLTFELVTRYKEIPRCELNTSDSLPSPDTILNVLSALRICIRIAPLCKLNLYEFKFISILAKLSDKLRLDEAANLLRILRCSAHAAQHKQRAQRDTTEAFNKKRSTLCLQRVSFRSIETCRSVAGGMITVEIN